MHERAGDNLFTIKCQECRPETWLYSNYELRVQQGCTEKYSGPCILSPEKTADISWHHHWFPHKMMSKKTRAEILYWRHITTQIWVVSSQQYGIYVQLLLWRHFVGKPVVVSWNVSCFHRLNSILILNMSRNYIMIKCTQLKKMGYCSNYSIRTPLAGYL